MGLDDKIARCKTDQDVRDKNSEACFEIFRLAFVDNDQEAWTALVEIFTYRVQGWILANSRFELAHTEPEILINDAFARFWEFASPHFRLSNYRYFGDCMNYLRRCAWSSLEDAIRRNRVRDRWDELTPWFPADLDREGMEELVFVNELYEVVEKMAGDNTAELIIIQEAWIYGTPPREIARDYPETFSSVKDVNHARRNLLRRMKRHPKIEQISKLMG
jgi:hypothetical protein